MMHMESVDFYLLPFMKPAYVKNIFVDGTPETYSDAVKEIIKREKIDYKDKRNVLVSHQFYCGRKKRKARKPVIRKCFL